MPLSHEAHEEEEPPRLPEALGQPRGLRRARRPGLALAGVEAPPHWPESPVRRRHHLPHELRRNADHKWRMRAHLHPRP